MAAMAIRFTFGTQCFERPLLISTFSGDIMKHLKPTAMATILMLAISFSAFAGDIETTLTSAAPAQSTATVAGEMGTTSATTSSTSSAATAVNPLTQVILVLLNLLPRI